MLLDQKLITYSRQQKNIINQLFTVQETVLRATREWGRSLKCPQCEEDFYTEEDNRIFRSDEHDVWIEKYPIRCKECRVEKQYFDAEEFMIEEDIKQDQREKDYNKVWYITNPDYNKEWRKQNPDKTEVYWRKAYQKNPEKKRAEAREYLKRPEVQKRRKEYRKQYYLINKDKVIERVKRNYQLRKLKALRAQGIHIEATIDVQEIYFPLPSHLQSLAVAAMLFKGEL